jgi:hypothetical protein
MRRLVVSLALLLCVACSGGPRRPPPDTATKPDSTAVFAFRDVPLMPGASFMISMPGGNVAEAKLRMGVAPDSVADYYRIALLSHGWQIVSDVRTQDGGVTIYARAADHRPVWLIIERNPAGAGTIMSVVGAGPRADSTASR